MYKRFEITKYTLICLALSVPPYALVHFSLEYIINNKTSIRKLN